jgi:putative spermidine/putrescine transport system substrate-binding protein
MMSNVLREGQSRIARWTRLPVFLLMVVSPLATAVTAGAQPSVTIATFGGGYQDALREALFRPAARRLGVSVREDTLRGIADVRLQVQGGAPTWDLVELAFQYCVSPEARTLFEPLDYALLPNALDLPPRLRVERGVDGMVVYAMVLAWRRDRYTGAAPTHWGDLLDVQRFPGARALYGQPRFTLEIALLADGVPPDRLYPLDVDRALRVLQRIKPHVTSFYAAHGQAVQLAKDREVDVMAILNGRIEAAIQDQAPWRYTFMGALVDTGCVAVPRGTRNRADAHRVLNELLSADLQAALPARFAYGPVNPRAFATGLIPPAVARRLPTFPEHVPHTVPLDALWWAQNEARVHPLWESFLQR